MIRTLFAIVAPLSRSTRHCVAAIMLLMAVAPSAVFAQAPDTMPRRVFFDFKEPSEDWVMMGDSKARYGLKQWYADGSFHMSGDSGSSGSMHKILPVDGTKDWSLTTKAKVISDGVMSNAGIYVQKGKNMYAFTVLPTMRAFIVLKYAGTHGGSKDKVTPMTGTNPQLPVEFSPSVKTTNEVNVINLRKTGDKITCRVNGELLKTFTVAEDMPLIADAIDGIGVMSGGYVGHVEYLDVEMSYTKLFVPYDAAAFKDVSIKYSPEVNSSLMDRYVTISPSGKSMYWTRPSVRNLDVITASRETDSTWTDVRFLDPPLNNQSLNSVIGVSHNDDTLYLFGKYRSDDTSDKGGIAMVSRAGDGWSAPVNLVTPGALADSDQCISSDGRHLISTIRRDGNADQADLYVSVRRSTTEFGNAQLLGAVNSQYDDCAPSLSADGKVLYFSSTRPGFGLRDIWVTKRLDDTWLNWSAPINLGPTINTIEDDHHFCLHPSGKYAYFVTTLNSHDGIYRVTIPQDEATRQYLPVR